MSNFTVSHALVAMFLEISSADGQVEKSELATLGQVSRKYIEADGSDFEQVMSETIDWYSGETDFDKRIGSIFSFASKFKEIFDKNTLILIAKDLVKIAQSDGNVHDREGQFFRACIECMGLTQEDFE